MPTTSTTKEEERTMNRVGGGGVAPRKRNDGFIHGKPVVPWFLTHLPTQFTRQSPQTRAPGLTAARQKHQGSRLF